MRAVVFCVVLLLVALPLFAIQITSVDDVIRMHRAGVSDDAIVDALAHVRDPLDVTREDVVAMKRAGLSDRVVEAVVTAARADAGPSGRSAEPAASAADDERSNGDFCRTFDPPVEIYPYFWPVPEWLWDPYWYMPRLDSTVGERAPVKPSTPAGVSVMRERRETPKRDAYRPPKQEAPRAIRPPSPAPRR